jgi:uncharacterized Zn-binding protein involved in type VI secretion
MGKPLSRIGDINSGGGKIIRGSKTVFANNRPVGLHVSKITPHPAGGPHKASVTLTGSPTVFAEGVPVLRVGSSTTCGHPIIQGSPTVFVS